MLNGNNQFLFTLPKNLNGDAIKLTGDQLFNSREVHHLSGSTKNIVLANPTDRYLPQAGEFVANIPTYSTGLSEADGQMNGGLIVAGINGVDFANHTVDTVLVGGSPFNVTPLLDQDHNEILKVNGDGIYVIAAVNSDTTADGEPLTAGAVSLNFVSVDSNGMYVAETVPAGSYAYSLNGMYAWATARHLELPMGGLATSVAGLSNTSREEVVVLMEANTPVPSHCTYTLTDTSDVEPDEVYSVTFNIKKDGSAQPVVTILGATSGNTSLVGTLNTSGVGILAQTGLGMTSGITAMFNGVTIKPENITVTTTTTDVNVVITNNGNNISLGKLITDDSFTIIYLSKKP